MAKLVGYVSAAILVSCASQPALAQMAAPSITSALPDVRSIGAANAAGVLQYCLKNGLVSSAATDSVLTSLTAKKGVTADPGYSAGQRGQIITGGKNFSLSHSNGYLKSQACDMVFQQAKHFK